MHAIFTLLALAASSQGNALGGDPSMEDFVVTDKAAYLVLPPQPVGGAQTVSMDWSPSGRYLLLGQAKPTMNPAMLASLLQGNAPPEQATTLWLWDKQVGRSTELGTIRGYDARRTVQTGLRWLPGEDVAMDLVTETIAPPSPEGEVRERASILRIDASAGRFQLVPLANPIPPGVFYQLYVSPAAGRALVLETQHIPRDPGTGQTVSKAMVAAWSIDAQGRAAKRGEVIEGMVSHVSWPADKTKAALHLMRIQEGKAQPVILLFDLATGSTQVASTKPAPYQGEGGKEPLETILLPSETSAGTAKRTHRAAWLRSLTPSDRTEYLLAPRAESAALNTPCDAVAVLDQGVVTVRLLVQVPLELYLEAKQAAEKAKAMLNAKMVATALHMFASDHDDRFPSPEEFSGIEVYIKNSEVSKGFVYLFKGGPFDGIERPAETPIGYMPAAGGYAIAYADGHVKWGKEPPKP